MDYVEKTEKHGKWDTKSVWPGIWQATLKHVENEKCIVYYLEYGEKTENHKKWETHTLGHEIWWGQWEMWKMRNTHCTTWIMTRKLKKVENEKHKLWDLEYGKKQWKTWKWDVHTVDLDYGEKTEKRGKGNANTVGTGIWRETLKNVQNEKNTL